MNENLNLVELLKDCPKWTKFYSTVYGDVYFDRIDLSCPYPVILKDSDGGMTTMTNSGLNYSNFNGECTLFPSRDQRDWSKWNVEKKVLEEIHKDRFDPSTLKPFDRVLVRDANNECWEVNLYGCYMRRWSSSPFFCINDCFSQCIPYEGNEHLLGTTNDCDDYYKTWED